MGDAIILEKCITFGPWGGSSGKEWIYVPEGCIKKIRISHGVAVNSIEFQSVTSKGGSQKSLFGCQGTGSRTDMICFDYPDEYLTSISGSTRRLYSYEIESLTSLCFHTNQNCYGPFGTSDKGTPFSYDGKGGVIVGFHGCDGKRIVSIGFYVMPKSLAMERYSTFEEDSGPKKCCRMLKIESPRDVGPWGAFGGKPWDDGVFYNIKQVRVQVGEPTNVKFGIQFKYVKSDGKFILSRLHGGTDGDVSELEVNLDGMQEYLTGISGYYGPVEGYNGLEGITSITLHTNKGKHGPYGQEIGAGSVYFTASSGKVVGFHGRSGDFLTAIGVHMEYF